MDIKNAIKKAVEEGYGSFTGSKWLVDSVDKLHGRCGYVVCVNTDGEIQEGKLWYRIRNIEHPYLDPKFWQCLFKDKTSISVVLDDAKTVLMNKECHYENGKYWMDIPQWRYYWHRLIDHLSEGKSIEDYFKQL